MSDDPCAICYRPPTAFSVGACAHPVCLECGARMRILLQTRECPICRAEMAEVTFCAAPVFSPTNPALQFLPAHGIRIEPHLRPDFERLLQNRCQHCGLIESTWDRLTRHAAKEHSLYACALCTENVKLFPWEHTLYSRPDLATHSRNTHPLCHFCSVRHHDKDALFKHLRRDHFFCHLCDADGYNFYYSSYAELRVHFRAEHWLCEEESCAEEMFTRVWREEVDWRAHIATAHSRLLGKHATRAARSLDVNFNLPARGGPSRQTSSDPVFVQRPAVDTGNVSEFPTLSGEPARPATTIMTATWSRVNRVVEDFPALSLGDTPQPPPPTQQPKWVNKSQGGALLSNASSHAAAPKQTSSARNGRSAEEFPSLAPSFVPLPAPRRRPKPKTEPVPPRPPPITPEQRHLELVRAGAVRLRREDDDERPLDGRGKK